MYVACPSCKAIYQIQAEHLHAARGQLRCGACRNTFSAFEAVFDDPAQALAYAEQQRAANDIEALVSKALEQVPRGEEAPEPHPEASAAEQQPAVEAEREALHPESVLKGTHEGRDRSAGQQQAEAIPAFDEQPVGEAGAESLQAEADYVPKGTQDAQPPEQRQAEPAVEEQPATGASAESEPPEPVSVLKGTQDDEAWSPQREPEDAIRADEEQPTAAAWSDRQPPEPASVLKSTDAQPPEAAYLPEDTQGERAEPPSTETQSGAAEGAPHPGSELPAEEPVGPEAEEPLAEAWGAAGPGTTPKAAAEAASISAAIQADLDFQAQPLAAEFVPRRREPVEPEPRVSTLLLLEHEYHEGISGRAWGAIAACVLLIALLVGQYGYVERYRLAAVPQLRPMLESGCRLLGCDLPLRHDVGRVAILEREVRDHPQVDDALLIHVTFANQADFVQPYPVFAVSFSDVSGSAVAARRFRPDEYLSDTRNPAGGMQPGERAQLMLEVVDPGERAVSFQFDFL